MAKAEAEAIAKAEAEAIAKAEAEAHSEAAEVVVAAKAWHLAAVAGDGELAEAKPRLEGCPSES